MTLHVGPMLCSVLITITVPRQWSCGQQNHEVLETNAGSMSSPFEIDVYGTNKLLLLV